MVSLKHLFRRHSIYDDLAEEIQQHLAEDVDRMMSEGMTRVDAEAAARRNFGNVTHIEELGREAWSFPTIDGFLGDLKFAVRRLKASPGFVLTAITTLALSIGANILVFSILNGLIFKPLGATDPKSLYLIGRATGVDLQSYPDYLNYRDRDVLFSGMLAYKMLVAGMSIETATVRSWGYATSANYFEVLGIQPALGRFFGASDGNGPGSMPYVVLSYEFWQRRFGGRSDVIGTTVALNQHRFQVIGVAPKSFRGTNAFFWPDFWMPVMNAEQVTGWSDLCCRDHLGFVVMGRLKRGVPLKDAAQSLNAMAVRMAREHKKDEGLTLQLRKPGPAGGETDPITRKLIGVMLLAALVLLAACANLASIFAARASDRGGELAVRMAIGANRWIVLRHLLAEAMVVSLAGGLVGSVLARVLLGPLSRWHPFGDFPTRLLVIPGPGVYALALVVSLSCGVLFCVLPARQVWRTDVVQTIKTGYVRTEGFRRFAFRDFLLLNQIVICTLLITASIVAIRGMNRAMHIQLGFNPADVTYAQGDLKMGGSTPQIASALQRRISEDAQTIRGVSSATVSDTIPFGSGGGRWLVYRWGTRDFLPVNAAFAATTFMVAPDYLQTVQMPLLAGRDFSWHDDNTAPYVAIVNDTFAHMLFGDTSAIGKRFALWAGAEYQVVGVVPDGKYYSVDERPQSMMLVPLMQGVGGQLATSTSVVVRSNLPEEQVASAVSAILRHDAPGVPFTVRAWSDAIDISLIPYRAITVLLAALGILAAVLALTGIFGMASYTVSKRMKELGIRIALGAERSHVIKAALSKPILLLCTGSALGIGAALLTSRAARIFDWFASPSDPLVVSSAALAMIVIGLIAIWAPARRTLAINPAKLLRES